MTPGVVLPSRPAGDGVVQEDEPVPRFKQGQKVTLVALVRLDELRRRPLAKADAGHVVKHIGVVAAGLLHIEQGLCGRLLHMGPVDAGHGVKDVEKGRPLERMPLGDEEHLLHARCFSQCTI